MQSEDDTENHILSLINIVNLFLLYCTSSDKRQTFIFKNISSSCKSVSIHFLLLQAIQSTVFELSLLSLLYLPCSSIFLSLYVFLSFLSLNFQSSFRRCPVLRLLQMQLHSYPIPSSPIISFFYDNHPC